MLPGHLFPMPSRCGAAYPRAPKPSKSLQYLAGCVALKSDRNTPRLERFPALDPRPDIPSVPVLFLPELPSTDGASPNGH